MTERRPDITTALVRALVDDLVATGGGLVFGRHLAETFGPRHRGIDAAGVDRVDADAERGQRAHRGLAAGAGALDADVEVLDALVLRGTAGVLVRTTEFGRTTDETVITIRK